MTINVIVAVSDNGVIGKDGKIPWKLSTDLVMYLYDLTRGHTLVSGRKTYEGFRPGQMKNNHMLVVASNQTSFMSLVSENENGYLTHAMPVQSVMRVLQDNISESDYFIIGGQKIYDEIFKTPELIHRVYLTRVHCNVEGGDAFFHHGFPAPGANSSMVWWEQKDGSMVKWKLIDTQFIPKSDKDEYDSTFQVWENGL